jgi:hypothetical protein
MPDRASSSGNKCKGAAERIKTCKTVVNVKHEKRHSKIGRKKHDSEAVLPDPGSGAFLPHGSGKNFSWIRDPD